MNITYRQVGDYQIPNLTLSPEESNIRLGKWGMFHKDYLKKHNPVLFTILLTQGNLYQYLSRIDQQAEEMFNTLTAQMTKSENLTEELKGKNQMEWVRRMNNIHHRAIEIVNQDLIYA